MTSCHLIPTWHKWNTFVDDIMMTWFTLHVNLVTSHWACMSCTCVHGTCTQNKYGAKYLSDLACTQAKSNLEKISIPHFQVLNSQNANKNMPNMFPIAYLNENLMKCNEDLAWGKQERLVHSHVFW